MLALEDSDARPVLCGVSVTLSRGSGLTEKKVHSTIKPAINHVTPFHVDRPAVPGLTAVNNQPDRASLAGAECLTLDAGVVSLQQRRICYKDGTEAKMTRMESALLRYLAERAGRIIGRDELLRDVWGLQPGAVHTRTVDMHMAMLRRKLREQGRNPQTLRTVSGQGYSFAAANAALART